MILSDLEECRIYKNSKALALRKDYKNIVLSSYLYVFNKQQKRK